MMMMMMKLKLLTVFLLLGSGFSSSDSSSSSSDDTKKSTTKSDVSVDLNLDFVGYEGVTDCDKDNEFIEGTSLSVSVVSKDGNRNNPKDGVYGVFCEETKYNMDGEEWTAYTKVDIQCAIAGIGRLYYDCSGTSNNKDCSECDDEAFQYSVGPWEDYLTPSWGMCYSSTSTVAATSKSNSDSNDDDDDDDDDETIVVTASWKFAKDSNGDDIDNYLRFYLDNSCIGDGPPYADSDSDSDSGGDSSDNACVTIDEVICGDNYPADELTTFCSLTQEFGPPPKPITIFVPNDDAFAYLETLMDVNDKDKLDAKIVNDILLFHAMDDVVLYNDLECSGLYQMDNKEYSRTKCIHNKDELIEKYQKGGGNRKNDVLPKIIIADILTCDGSVIHVVNEVMLPNYIDLIEK